MLITVRGLPSLELLLRSNPYPGRGLVAARTHAGGLVVGFFVTGRSPASQDRVLTRDPGGDVVVGPEHGGPADPFRHYTALARRGDWLCVGNGCQVEPLATSLASGTDPLAAFSEHGYTQDEPFFTSRLTLALRLDGEPRVLLGATRKPLRDTDAADVVLLGIGALQPAGAAVLITTYQSDGDHVGPAQGYREVATDVSDRHELLDCLWGALTPEYRVCALALDVADPDDVLLRND
ncbi:IMP cyclohydrolase [Thalassiella azotivora]